MATPDGVWTLTETRGEQMAYCTEASDLGLRSGPARAHIECPECGDAVAGWTARRRANEIQAWATVCLQCHAALTIFND